MRPPNTPTNEGIQLIEMRGRPFTGTGLTGVPPQASINEGIQLIENRGSPVAVTERTGVSPPAVVEYFRTRPSIISVKLAEFEDMARAPVIIPLHLRIGVRT
eukprot:2747421-Heterocapsa_arctica.AAC.1